MAGDVQYVLTLGNSIIGVSVLAMPYCFQQCGILLSVLLLVGINLVTRVACHLLLKAAILCRRRNYEMLAYATFGAGGKLAVELSMIGFLVGTCVAFFVVIGDLGPTIAARCFQVENNASLRSVVMLVLAFVVVLPLCLLRNIESLTGIAILSFIFYFVLVLKVFFASFGHVWNNDWIENVKFWEPSGMLVCIPIFSMALSCQTQIFEIYDSMPDPTLHKMNNVVSGAVNMCTFVYAAVGLFGYLAFFDFGSSVDGGGTQSLIPGNILMTFPETAATECIKFFYVLSVALSFPLVLFPCRASIHSLLFPPSQQPASHDMSALYIPESRFRTITFFVVVISLGMGLLLPAIEIVLSLMGSTIGLVICLIFPATIFIKNTSKNTNERASAQVILCIGIFLMVAGTYTNLMAIDNNRALDASPLEKLPPPPPPVAKLEASKPPADSAAGSPVPDVPAKAVEKSNVSKPVKDDVQKSPERPPNVADQPPPKDPDYRLKSSSRDKEQRSRRKPSETPRRLPSESRDPPAPAPGPAEVEPARGTKKSVLEPAKAKLEQGQVPAGRGPAKEEEKIFHQLAEEQEQQRQILDEQRKLIDDLKEGKLPETEPQRRDEPAPAPGPKDEAELKAVAIDTLETQLKELSDLKQEMKKVGEGAADVPREPPPAAAARDGGGGNDKNLNPAPAPSDARPGVVEVKPRLQEPYVLAKRSEGSRAAPVVVPEGGTSPDNPKPPPPPDPDRGGVVPDPELPPKNPDVARGRGAVVEDNCPVPGDCPVDAKKVGEQERDREMR